jgi:hypothetical protein
MASSEPQAETNLPAPAANPSRWDLSFLSQLSFNELLYHVLFGDKQSGPLKTHEA